MYKHQQLLAPLELKRVLLITQIAFYSIA